MEKSLTELKERLETVAAEMTEIESAFLGVSLLSFLIIFHR